MSKITIERLIESGAVGLSVELMRDGPHAGKFEGRVLMPGHQGESVSHSDTPNGALSAVKDFHMDLVSKRPKKKQPDDGLDLI